VTGCNSHVLYEGDAEGEVLWLDDPLSLWGGFDPQTGEIIDRNHPQCGACLAGKIVFMPGTRGSAGTPGGLAEALRRGTGPLAIILGRRDANVVIGAAVAERLYGCRCPVLELPLAEMEKLRHAERIAIAQDGQITVLA
jgi:predicted aconitase with swiveling domain